MPSAYDNNLNCLPYGNNPRGLFCVLVTKNKKNKAAHLKFSCFNSLTCMLILVLFWCAGKCLVGLPVRHWISRSGRRVQLVSFIHPPPPL